MDKEVGTYSTRHTHTEGMAMQIMQAKIYDLMTSFNLCGEKFVRELLKHP